MPIPVSEQFTNEQKDTIIKLWNEGYTQVMLANTFNVPRRTMMKLCKQLNLNRNTKEVANIIGFKSFYDTTDNIETIKRLRNTHTLAEIGRIIGCSSNAINRLCTKYEIKLDKTLYAKAQAEKMKNAWTPEKKKAASGSIYWQLNDKEWLIEHYVTKNMAMGQIAAMIGAPLMSVSHHLRRHEIKLKNKEQYLSKLRRETAKRRKVNTRWGQFEVQSMAEERFLQSLPETTQSVKVEPYTYTFGDMQYVPDFEIDGKLVEVKPPEYSIKSGVNRQKFMKQKLIADHNNVDFRCWYYKGFQSTGGFFGVDPIDDEDRYFCLNWKLVFVNSDECFEFLVRYGFKELQWAKDRLLMGLNNMFRATEGNKLNANYRNETVVNFIIHFNNHYWHSTHKGYNPIAKAFEIGNRVILKDAIKTLWDTKSEVNIYSLVRTIARMYKDFTPVGIFKPWIAKHIYETLLPNGGTIIDPCMGWGGRLLGTLDSNYNYIGYDLNPNVILAHEKIKKFVGSRFTNSTEFHLADSSKILWPKGDLLFTSPPYDDTEHYHGLETQCKDTDPIYDNIMCFNGIVALNVPLRHQERCIKIAKKHGRPLINEFKMRTANFIGRETTYEPIIVFGA